MLSNIPDASASDPNRQWRYENRLRLEGIYKRILALDTLPIAIRASARDALKGHREKLSSLGAYARRYSSSRSMRGLLPVVFHNLDPTLVPKSSSSNNAKLNSDKVYCALVAIDILGHIHDAPTQALIELWRGVWTWLHFLESRLHLLPDLRSPESMYPLLAALRSMTTPTMTSRSKVLDTIVHATSEVLPFLGRLWFQISSSSDKLAHKSCSIIHEIICTYDNSFESTIFASLARDLPSGPADLAQLIIDGLNSVSTCPCCDVKDHSLLSLTRLVAGTVKSPAHWQPLLASGIVSTLTKLLPTLVKAGDPFALKLAFGAVFCALDDSKHVLEAIRAGLFQGLANVLRDRALDFLPKGLFLPFFGMAIPAGGMYRPIVRACSRKSVKSVLGDSAGIRTDMRQIWDATSAILAHNSDILAQFERHEAVDSACCANPACDVVKPRTELKRCKTCAFALYCSNACQRAHWRNGTHREDCKKVAASKDERPSSFSRYRVADDCAADALTVLYAQLRYLATNPQPVQASSVVTVLDYRPNGPALSPRLRPIFLVFSLPNDSLPSMRPGANRRELKILCALLRPPP
ncbi:hypothetical protein MKEN_00976100 [Mycena kentingensis (nom. inval.)]|nr:hypothetical protein MKEN_00976100 [Mycena kentingensis (nom. inval.)]